MLAFALHLFLAVYFYRMYHKIMFTWEPGLTFFLVWFYQLIANMYWVGDWDFDDILFLNWKKTWIFILLIYIIISYLIFHLVHRFTLTRSGTADVSLISIFLMQNMIKQDINNNLLLEHPEYLKREWYNSQIKYSKKFKFDLIRRIKIYSILLVCINIYFLYNIYIYFYITLHVPITPLLLKFEKFYIIYFLKFFKIFFFINFFTSFIAPNTNSCWLIYYFPYEPFDLYSDVCRRHQNNDFLMECYYVRNYWLNWTTVHKCSFFYGNRHYNNMGDNWNFLFTSRSKKRYHLSKTWYLYHNPVIDCFVNTYYFKYWIFYQWFLKLFFWPFESYAGFLYDKKRKVERKFFYHENLLKILLFGRNYTCDHTFDNSIKKYKIK